MSTLINGCDNGYRLYTKKISCHPNLSGSGMSWVRALRNDNFFEDSIDAANDLPIGIVPLELREIRDVADMVTFACFVNISPFELALRQRLDTRNRLKN